MSYFHTFTRDDGTKVTVEYEVDSYGEPNYDNPGHICDGSGSPPEISIVKAFTDTADVVLTDDEEGRCIDQIIENLEPPEYDDYD